MTNLTSDQAALLLFGQDLYREYCEWQVMIDDDDQIQYYEDVSTWASVRGSIISSLGELPEILVYQAFMEFLLRQGRLYPSHDEPQVTSLVVANDCRHTIHPGNPSTEVDVCPVCVVEECADSLSRIWSVWFMLGAPTGIENSEVKHLYCGLRTLWRFEKARWANLVMMYEIGAELEEVWEDTEMQSAIYTFDELNNASSCRAALQTAWASNPYKLDGYDKTFTPRPLSERVVESPKLHTMVPSESSISKPADHMRSSPPGLYSPQSQLQSLPFRLLLAAKQSTTPTPSPNLTQTPPPQFCAPPTRSTSEPSTSSSLPASPLVDTKKRARFAADVEHCEQRSVLDFHRASIDYRPGRHACSSTEGWEDTSFKNVPQYPDVIEENLDEDFDICRDADSESDTDTDTGSESEPESESESGDFRDAEATSAVWVPNRDVLADITASSASLVDRNREVESQEPRSFLITERMVERRNRATFEAESAATMSRRKVKRQRQESV